MLDKDSLKFVVQHHVDFLCGELEDAKCQFAGDNYAKFSYYYGRYQILLEMLRELKRSIDCITNDSDIDFHGFLDD